MRWKSSISNSLASSHRCLTLSETNPDLAPTPAAAFIVFSFLIDIAPPLLSCAFGRARARSPHPYLSAHGASTARSGASRNHDDLFGHRIRSAKSAVAPAEIKL